MQPQPHGAPSPGSGSPSEPSGGPLRRFLAWTPVWIALVVLAQVALLGLRPALAERRRLAEAQLQMRLRLEREERQALELERIERAQNDAIYLERERKLLRKAADGGQGDGRAADARDAGGAPDSNDSGNDPDAPARDDS